MLKLLILLWVSTTSREAEKKKMIAGKIKDHKQLKTIMVRYTEHISSPVKDLRDIVQHDVAVIDEGPDRKLSVPLPIANNILPL